MIAFFTIDGVKVDIVKGSIRVVDFLEKLMNCQVLSGRFVGHFSRFATGFDALRVINRH